MGARDRFLWASLLLLEHVRDRPSDDLFDLWLHARDLNFYEYAVSLRTREEEWEFVGDVSGYHDGETPYSGGDRDRICTIHALDRDRYLDGGELEVQIEPNAGANGATLHAVYAMPHLDVARYATEPELTDLCATADLEPYRLGGINPGRELSAEDGYRELVEVSPPETSIADLPVRDSADQSLLEELRDRETQTPPRGLFDLWVYGRDLSETRARLGGGDVEEYRDGQVGVHGDLEAIVYRGLKRFAFFEAHTSGHSLSMSIESNDSAEIRGAFAMPYHGTDNVVAGADVARLIRDDFEYGEGEIETFSLACRTWPTGARVGEKTPLTTHLQYYPRSIRDAALEFEGSSDV